MVYTTVSSETNMKSPYNSHIVTSDNYKVMLTVIRKKAVHIVRANGPSVTYHFSHRCGPRCWSFALLVTCSCTPDRAEVRRSFRSATLSLSLR